MHLRRLWLTDFRSYEHVGLELPDGLTAVLGPNGRGKSNLLEAVAYLGTLRSFRGAPSDALVRVGAERAVVRGEVVDDGRDHLVEAEVARSGRSRVLVDKQRLARTRDLLATVRTTVFSPDDLDLVKGGPAGRRGFLDDGLVALHPPDDAVRSDWERALRQRNALLKQVHGRPDESALLTLEVWDEKLAAAGDRLGELRSALVARLQPVVERAYRDVASSELEVGLRYEAPWRGMGLRAALAAARADELRRGLTLVGPHRDELLVELRGLPSRTHASQGEQRSLALALRLSMHRAASEVYGSPPVLLLDDVFSELDPDRSAALLRALPPGQTMLSSASGLPSGIAPALSLHVGEGAVSALAGGGDPTGVPHAG
jgi:DNA replication and repair protein RecF